VITAAFFYQLKKSESIAGGYGEEFPNIFIWVLCLNLIKAAIAAQGFGLTSVRKMFI